MIQIRLKVWACRLTADMRKQYCISMKGAAVLLKRSITETCSRMRGSGNRRKGSDYHPRYDIDYNGWHVEGTWTEWNYTITDRDGNTVAAIGKELFNLTDTYVIDVNDPDDALYALMFVLAIDAEKCSRN